MEETAAPASGSPQACTCADAHLTHVQPLTQTPRRKEIHLPLYSVRSQESARKENRGPCKPTRAGLCREAHVSFVSLKIPQRNNLSHSLTPPLSGPLLDQRKAGTRWDVTVRENHLASSQPESRQNENTGWSRHALLRHTSATYFILLDPITYQ